MDLSLIVGVGVKKKDISNIKIGNKLRRTRITTLSLSVRCANQQVFKMEPMKVQAWIHRSLSLCQSHEW